MNTVLVIKMERNWKCFLTFTVHVVSTLYKPYLFLLLNRVGISLLKKPPPAAVCAALAPPEVTYCCVKGGVCLRVPVPYAYVLRAGAFLVKLGLVGMLGILARSIAGRRWLCGAVLEWGDEG